MLDLSRRGARLKVAGIYKLRSRIVLAHVGDEAVFDAVVKWCTGDALGLSFEERHSLADCAVPRLRPVTAAWEALRSVEKRASA